MRKLINRFKRDVHKWYRTDKDLWETKKIIFWFIPYYKYSIWKEGKVHTHTKLIKYSKPVYLKKAIKTTIYVGKKEFVEEYNGNIYLIPQNFKLNLDLP